MFQISSEISHVDNVTAAAYVLYGGSCGMFSKEEIENWCYSVIASQDSPPIEIIKTAMTTVGLGLDHLYEYVHESRTAAPDKVDIQLVGRWLLWELLTEFRKDAEGLLDTKAIIDMVTVLVTATDQPKAAKESLRLVDTEWGLVYYEELGTIQACRESLMSVLEEYGQEYKNSEPWI
jgi:hypothetical protein